MPQLFADSGGDGLVPGRSPAPWTYAQLGDWGTLDPAYALCRVGRAQSPVDLPAPAGESPLKTVSLAYRHSAGSVLNNGHTIQVECEPGSWLVLNGAGYQLEQFHFHAPSEHRLAGHVFAMEMHLVHRSEDGRLAVLGVMLASGPADNPVLAPVWQAMPRQPGKQAAVVRINIRDLLPLSLDYLTYEGSLTTPPCSEGVHWLVLTAPVAVSLEQVARFTTIIGQNARPVQALYGRPVTEGQAVDSDAVSAK